MAGSAAEVSHLRMCRASEDHMGTKLDMLAIGSDKGFALDVSAGTCEATVTETCSSECVLPAKHDSL
jgi:hypothetical protein